VLLPIGNAEGVLQQCEEEELVVVVTGCYKCWSANGKPRAS